jgi:hypothetical protein
MPAPRGTGILPVAVHVKVTLLSTPQRSAGSDAENKITMPKPAKYDPARFELARRMLKAGIKVGFDMYSLPGNKIAVQDLPYPKLRERLLAHGQALKLPPPPKQERRATVQKSR